MANDLELKNEERNRNLGLLVSAILHLLLTLIVFVTGFTYYDPPLQPINSVLIAFSEAQPQSDYAADISDNESDGDIQENVKEDVEEVKNETTPSSSSSSSLQEDDSPVVKQETKNANTNDAQPSKEEIEADLKAKAEAQKRAEAEKREEELAKSKQKFSDILGKGKDASSQEGTEGSSENIELENLSKGSGSVGTGFGNRSVLYEPVINETSQKQGVVVVSICINSAGDVVKARFTQNGSTTTDTKLVKIAEKAARKYKFTPSDTPEQCGDIVIEFKVQ